MTFPPLTWVYVGALIVFSLGSLGRWAMFRTALAMLLNWAACSGIVLWFGQDDLWAWFALFDVLACIVVTVRPAGKIQAAVGAIYVADLLCHFSYGMALWRGGQPNEGYYLTMLDRLAFLQLGLLCLWLGGVGLRGLGRRFVRLAHPRAGGAVMARMD